MKNAEKELKQLQQKYHYYDRKFYEISQEILDISECTSKIIDITSDLTIRLHQVSQQLARITKKKTWSSKSHITANVGNNIGNGISYTSGSIADEFGVTKDEARYIIRQLVKTQPDIIKVRLGKVVEIKKR